MIYFENLIYEIKVPLGFTNKAKKIFEKDSNFRKNQDYLEHMG